MKNFLNPHLENFQNPVLRGQALLFVVVAMTIALALGLSVSSRTISTISRVSQTDTSSRVRAVAEAGAENYLSKTPSELNQAVSGGAQSINIGGVEGIGDDIVGEATVTVTKDSKNYTTSGGTGAINFNVEKGTVAQYSLPSSGNVNVCYQSLTPSSTNSAIYLILYDLGDDPSVIDRRGYIDSPDSNFTNFTQFGSSASIDSDAYDGCVSVDITGSNTMRVMSLIDDVKIGLVSSDLPQQLYKIVSVGTLEEAGTAKATAEVTVYKSELFSPAPLDFAIYSQDSGWTY